jgi:hypothetical protein
MHFNDLRSFDWLRGRETTFAELGFDGREGAKNCQLDGH